MTMDEMKERYRAVQEQIRRLEAVRAEATRRGDPTPRRIQFNLDMARIEAEELRMWGNRELTRQLREGL
jgi:phage protein U